MRDWSSLGEIERNGAYQPVLNALNNTFGENRDKVKVLVPGCGLGRLVWECFNNGYDVEGNEFSLYMLIVSSFILNKCADIGPGEFQYRIYPFIHEKDNILDWGDVEKEVLFPDVTILKTKQPNGQMNMAMGEFLDVYKTPNHFQAILSVFFIDTAHNVAEYIEKFYQILSAGGIWINNGPLLYHYADTPGEESIELSWTEIKQIIVKIGFTIEEERIERGLFYTQNPAKLLKSSYDTIFFVARKS